MIIFFIEISSVQTVTCYTCIDCGDPFNGNSANVTQSPSSCPYCYVRNFLFLSLHFLYLHQKLTVFMAYAPSRYIVKECVQTCTESGGSWGGSSLQVNCCSTTLCNNAFGIYYKYTWKNRFFLRIIPNIFMLFFINKIRQ